MQTSFSKKHACTGDLRAPLRRFADSPCLCFPLRLSPSSGPPPRTSNHVVQALYAANHGRGDHCLNAGRCGLRVGVQRGKFEVTLFAAVAELREEVCLCCDVWCVALACLGAVPRAADEADRSSRPTLKGERYIATKRSYCRLGNCNVEWTAPCTRAELFHRSTDRQTHRTYVYDAMSERWYLVDRPR